MVNVKIMMSPLPQKIITNQFRAQIWHLPYIDRVKMERSPPQITSGLVVLQGILLKLILSGFYVKILGQILLSVLMRMESLPGNRWRRRFVFLIAKKKKKDEPQSLTRIIIKNGLNLKFKKFIYLNFEIKTLSIILYKWRKFSHEKKTKSTTNFTSIFQHPLNLFQVQVFSSIQSLFKFITSSSFFFNSILVDPWLSQLGVL